MNGVFEHLDDVKGKVHEQLEAGREMAYLSRQLVTIEVNLDLPVTPSDCVRQAPDPAVVNQVFTEYNFQSILPEEMSLVPVEEMLEYILVLTEEVLCRAIDEMRQAGCFAVDTETTSLDVMQASLVGVSLCCQAAKAYYIPVAHDRSALYIQPNPDELFSESITPLPKETVLTLLRPLLEDPSIGKIGHNIKYDYCIFARAGILLGGIVMDTMVASYLTDPSRLRHNLTEVSLHYLNHNMIPIADLIGKGAKSITFDFVPVDRACEYACEDADMAWRLNGVFTPLLRERNLEALCNEIEVPLIGVLARMEMTGIAIDETVFKNLEVEIGGRLAALEEEIYQAAGETFLINSPKQLQSILFDKLKLRPKRKTKTGYSTDVEVLEELALEHPLPEKMLEYRSLDKLRSTYLEAIPKLKNPITGRIHTSFNQAITATGRLSSSDPNLQNIPVRTELGKRIREGFVAQGPEWRLISADYSQIELRILAHLSQDENLLAAFRNKADIHRETAARVFGVSADAVTSEMRRQAKAVNFGVVYGISPYGLAKGLGISNAEAERFISHYFAQYPGIKTWMEMTIENARRDGYVTTLLQRRRYVPELASSDGNVRKGAERAAMNTPVQGTAADVIKKAMVQLDAALRSTNARLVLQVHDELLVESPTDKAEEVAQLVQTIMENALPMDVALSVDVHIGMNWSEIH